MAAMTRNPAWQGIAVPVALAAGAALLWSRPDVVMAVLAWVRGQGALAPVAYAVVYAIAVPLLVPGSLLTLTGGALFGLWPGVPAVFAGAVAGSSLAFFVSRYVSRPLVERWMAGHDRLSVIDRAVAADGVRIVFLLRLTPLVPFTVLNYLLGLTRLRWREMIIASPGMLPGTLLYVYYGHVIGDVAAVVSGARPPRSTAQYVLLAVGLVAAVLVAWRVSRIARRALAAAALVPGPPAA
jgi:uncharacterized membrane protein YdjX (TVP38/TMEM64 family)